MHEAFKCWLDLGTGLLKFSFKISLEGCAGHTICVRTRGKEILTCIDYRKFAGRSKKLDIRILEWTIDSIANAGFYVFSNDAWKSWTELKQAASQCRTPLKLSLRG
ncbi:hypothetical protein ACET3Z_015542 [Daucus carota]